MQIFKNRTSQNLKQISLDELKRKSYNVTEIARRINEISRQEIKAHSELRGIEKEVFLPRVAKTHGEKGDRASVQVAGLEPPEVVKRHAIDILPRKKRILAEIDQAIQKAPQKAAPGDKPSSLHMTGHVMRAC